uniref:Uncharacterized protein n=1 Tax=Anguilla anguilla TaxID=7936 RepID=A0A0E9SKD7_ANGAN
MTVLAVVMNFLSVSWKFINV